MIAIWQVMDVFWPLVGVIVGVAILMFAFFYATIPECPEGTRPTYGDIATETSDGRLMYQEGWACV